MHTTCTLVIELRQLPTPLQRLPYLGQKAVLAANREMLALYWDIGRIIISAQLVEGWGAGVLQRIARDLKNEAP